MIHSVQESTVQQGPWEKITSFKMYYIRKVNLNMLLCLTQYDPKSISVRVKCSQEQLYQITPSLVNLENNLFSLSTKGSGGQNLKSVPLGTHRRLAGSCFLWSFCGRIHSQLFQLRVAVGSSCFMATVFQSPTLGPYEPSFLGGVSMSFCLSFLRKHLTLLIV